MYTFLQCTLVNRLFLTLSIPLLTSVQEEIKVFSSWTAALDTKYLYKTEQVAIAGYSSPLPLPSAFTGNAEGRGSRAALTIAVRLTAVNPERSHADTLQSWTLSSPVFSVICVGEIIH